MKSASLGPQRTKCISAIEVWDQDIRRSANPAGDTTLSELGTFVIEVIFTIMEEAPFCDVPSNYRFAPDRQCAGVRIRLAVANNCLTSTHVHT
jgi:hypothetical protein